MNYTASPIIPGLLYMRGRTNTVASMDRLMKMRRDLRLYRVICLTNRPDPIWNELHVLYNHWAMSDGQTLPAWLPERVALVANNLREGLPVLVYCESGRNRSGLFCALVARDYLKITGHEAIMLVRNARPMALQNPTFVKLLEGLGRHG